MGLTYEDLRICYSLVREANDLKDRMERLRSLAEWCTAAVPTSGGSGVGAKGDRTGDMVSRLVDMEQESKRRIQAYMTHAQHVDAAISELEDSTQRMILRMRYVDGLTWETISERTHYHERWCRQQHTRGLENMGLKKHSREKPVQKE